VTFLLALLLSGCTPDKSLLPALIHASIALHVGDADMFWLCRLFYPFCYLIHGAAFIRLERGISLCCPL
jgi:hypothetical protein